MRFSPIRPYFFLVLIFAARLSGQTSDHAGWFPFYMPWDDSSKNVTDLSANLDAPAGKYGFLDIAGGHFKFHDNGERARFTGFVSVAQANFPSHQDAPAVAARLARFGVNILRIHLLDVVDGYGLFSHGTVNTRDIDPDRWDKMDFFFNCLKQRGIYVDLGLHVGRVFAPGDSLPAPITNAQSKFATIFHPRLIALQKDYARTLFNHVNPYTGLAYKADPFIAFTELTNENSLFLGWLSWGADQFKPGAAGSMDPYYGTYLDSLWRDWLKTRYATDSALGRAWSGAGNGSADSAANLVSNPSFETGLSGWFAWASKADGADMRSDVDSTVSVSGKRSARVEVLSAGKDPYMVQLACLGLTVAKGKSYALTFHLRASAPATFAVEFLKESVWTWYGNKVLQADTGWKAYRVFFSATETLKDSLRFNFDLSYAANVTYWVDSVEMREYQGDGLLAGESLSTQVKRLEKTDVGGFTDARVSDQAEFYYDVEGRYIAGLTAFLKDTLGVKVPVTFTNNYYGLASIVSQSRADYMDAHSYWDHPNFPHGWSASDFTIRNQPMVKSPAAGTILEMALSRVAGKPFVVSEYNHPFPNSYLCEAPAFFFGYLGFFDADGAYWHAYNDYSLHYQQTYQGDFFTVGTNPVLMTQMLLGKAFLKGDIAPAKDPTPVDFTFSETLKSPKKFGDSHVLNTADGMSPLYPMHHPIAYRDFHAPATTVTAAWPQFTDKVTSSTGELDWDGADGLFKVSSPSWQGITGYLGSAKPVFPAYALSNIKTTANRDFAAVHLIALDSLPISASHHLVLLTSGRVENRSTAWNASATSLATWDLPGDTAICEPVTGQISFAPSEPGKFALYPLDPRGNRRAALPLRSQGDRLYADLPGTTLWYEVELGGGTLGINGNGQSGAAKTRAWAGRPIGVAGTLRLPYAIPSAWGRTEVKVEIYSVAGKTLLTRSARFNPGLGSASWDGEKIPLGFSLAKVSLSSLEGPGRADFGFKLAR
ncbi:MAG: carbohydrate binding domain-containing protein [Fibrobacteres bacterium]|nr:carbohydrate binding domain-containing protein [Fibrobacterota bacterium]